VRHDIDLVPLAADFAVVGHERAAADNFARLNESGSTGLVTAARMMTMHATIVATGTISVFEGLLQQSLGWDDPFRRIDRHLRQHGEDDLAERLLDYRAAINVLKHGAGRSHERLLQRKDQLDFAVRSPDQAFHDEGDVSEVGTLVRADATFVKNCARLIEEVASALRRTVPNAPL